MSSAAQHDTSTPSAPSPSTTTPAADPAPDSPAVRAPEAKPAASPHAGTGCPEGFVTADVVAAELARVTGRRSVAPSTVRAMSSRGQLPQPAPQRWGRRLLWRRADITAWLEERERRHVPRDVVRRIQRRLTHLDEQARLSGNDARLKQGVRNARERGLSFQQIADAIMVKSGDRHPTREAVRARFGPYL